MHIAVKLHLFVLMYMYNSEQHSLSVFVMCAYLAGYIFCYHCLDYPFGREELMQLPAALKNEI